MKLKRFFRTMAFKLRVINKVKARKMARYRLIDFIWIFRNKKRYLTRREQKKYIYYRWLLAAKKRIHARELDDNDAKMRHNRRVMHPDSNEKNSDIEAANLAN